MIFKDRQQAGQLLAQHILLQEFSVSIVIGLTRGGVVVAAEIARSLKAPLKALVIKKLSAPQNPELAIGAVAPDNISFIDWDFVNKTGVAPEYITSQIKELSEDIITSTKLYGTISHEDLQGKTVILTDDGVATGATVIAATNWLHSKNIGRVILAIPVMPADFTDKIRNKVDKIIVLNTPSDLGAVGEYYEQFKQVRDEDVLKLVRIKN